MSAESPDLDGGDGSRGDRGPARGTRLQRLRLPLMLLAPAAIVVGAYLYLTSGRYQSTDDAYTQAATVSISANVAGRVLEIYVHDNEIVKRGEPLYRLDDAPFRIAVSDAEAKLASTRLQIASLKSTYRQKQVELHSARDTLAYAQRPNLPREFHISALLERIIIRMGRGRPNMLWRTPRPANPMPKQVLCANPDPAHGGLIARCKGMSDAMKAAGINTETLATDSDPARAANILSAYLARCSDVNYIYAVTSESGPTVWTVCNEMGLHPDLGDTAHKVTIIGVDDNPVSLSGVKAGHLLSTVSQEFWLQGYVPLQRLYWYREYGYTPESDILTGPVIIDKTNVDHWITLVQGVIGPDNFKKQTPW